MWYTANLLFKGTYGADTNAEPLWEETIRLIEAESEEDAHGKAIQLSAQDETIFKNVNDQTVTWKFYTVERIFVIDEANLRHGIEIFSRFLRDSEVKSLLTPFAE
jgi:hypothetical protein